MKTKEKIMLALILAMVLGLFGCGNSEPAMNDSVAVDYSETGTESMESDTGEIKESKEEATEESNPEPTAEPTPTPTANPTLEPTATPSPTASPEPTPMHVHDYAESITTQATCSTAGERKLTCECGESKTEQIPATGQHNWVEGTTTIHHVALGHVEVVKTQVGTSEGRTEYECAVCGHREDSPDALSEHRASFVGVDRTHATARTVAYDYPGEPIYEETQVWQVDQAAWDEVVGTGIYTCTTCGQKKE